MFRFLNGNIEKSFDWNFSEILKDSNYMTFWQQGRNSSSLNESDINSTNFFLQIVPTFVIITILQLKHMYNALSLIPGMLSLWLISRDFQQRAFIQFADRAKIQGNLNHFRSICKLSNIFRQGHGMLLLFEILNGILDYSLFIGFTGNDIFTMEIFGFQFHFLEFLLLFSTLQYYTERNFELQHFGIYVEKVQRIQKLCYFR